MNNTLSRVCVYVCMWGDESLGWHVMLSRCVTACMRPCRYVCVCVCARARALVCMRSYAKSHLPDLSR